jgi:hypothetical protein
VLWQVRASTAPGRHPLVGAQTDVRSIGCHGGDVQERGKAPFRSASVRAVRCCHFKMLLSLLLKLLFKLLFKLLLLLLFCYCCSILFSVVSVVVVVVVLLPHS